MGEGDNAVHMSKRMLMVSTNDDGFRRGSGGCGDKKGKVMYKLTRMSVVT